MSTTPTAPIANDWTSLLPAPPKLSAEAQTIVSGTNKGPVAPTTTVQPMGAPTGPTAPVGPSRDANTAVVNANAALAKFGLSLPSLVSGISGVVTGAVQGGAQGAGALPSLAQGMAQGAQMSQAAGQTYGGAQPQDRAMAQQTPQFDVNAMLTNIMGQVTQMYQQAGNDAGTQAMISSWMDQMSGQITALESQIMKQIQDRTGNNDGELQAALGSLREQFDESRKAIIEDMAARGLAQSGVSLEMESRLQKGLLSESQKMVASRLSEMQNLIMNAMMQFAQLRMQAQSQGLNLQVQASEAAKGRAMQAAQTGIGAMLNATGMLNQNQQAGLDRDLQKALQQSQQQFQGGMQGKEFAQQEKMAGINYQNQLGLQNNQQAFQTTMQGNQFAQDEKMAGIAHKNNLDLNAAQYAQQQALQAAGFGHDEKMAGVNYNNQLSLQNNAYGHQQSLQEMQNANAKAMQQSGFSNDWMILQDQQRHDKDMQTASQAQSDLTRLNQHVMEKYLPLISSGQLTPQQAVSKLNEEMQAAAAAGFPWSDQHKAYATTLVNSYAMWGMKQGTVPSNSSLNPRAPSMPMAPSTGVDGILRSFYGTNNLVPSM